MDTGSGPDADTLDRLRDLCADLAGELGSGQMLAWADACAPAALPDVVFAVVRDAGLLAAGAPARGNLVRSARQFQKVSVPADADELWSRMWEVDEAIALDLLDGLEGGNAPDRSRRSRRLRRYRDEPSGMFSEIARLTGRGTRWWTNTDLTTWNPITQHTFDALIVGAGNGIVVTLIAFEGG